MNQQQTDTPFPFASSRDEEIADLKRQVEYWQKLYYEAKGYLLPEAGITIGTNQTTPKQTPLMLLDYTQGPGVRPLCFLEVEEVEYEQSS